MVRHDDGQTNCPICGEQGREQREVLWPELVEAWGLTPEEAALINRQQGLTCTFCGGNLRSMTLAFALLKFFEFDGPLRRLSQCERARKVRLLEINQAGTLSEFLQQLPHHLSVSYPDVDIQDMATLPVTFDVVIHSDTLEHVADPVRGLSECKRILKPGGRMFMTVPIVPTRLGRSREGLSPSYHGSPNEAASDLLVHTEYGADFYLDLIKAGWRRMELVTLGSPDSLAIVAINE